MQSQLLHLILKRYLLLFNKTICRIVSLSLEIYFSGPKILLQMFGQYPLYVFKSDDQWFKSDLPIFYMAESYKE